MDDFLKEWGYPLLFGLGVYMIFKPKDGTGAGNQQQQQNTGGSSSSGSGTTTGSGTGAGTNTPVNYTYDCQQINCSDILSEGVSRQEVIYLKQFINWFRNEVLESIILFPIAFQIKMHDLNSQYPYLDTSNPTFGADLREQLYIITGGLTSGSLISIARAIRNQINFNLSSGNPLRQEVNEIVNEMEQTLFN